MQHYSGYGIVGTDYFNYPEFGTAIDWTRDLSLPKQDSYL